MKVLYLIDALAFGGAENTLLTLLRHAEHGGFDAEVAVVAPPSEEYARWLPAFRAHGVEPRFLGVERVRQPNALPRIVRAVKDSGADVVHAHLGTAATFAHIAARAAARHALCTLHTMAYVTDPAELRRERLSVAAASRSSGLVFVSRASRDSFARRYRRNRATWTVVPNGVDLDVFRPGSRAEVTRARGLLGVPAGVPVAVHVGALRPMKGQDAAVEAWRLVLLAHPEARLVLVGDGPEEARLRALAHASGVAHRVVFAGMRENVHELLRGADLLVHPTARDALPTVLLEAAASGLAAVATRVDGVPEVVASGETGWLVDRPEPERLAAALVDAFADRAALDHAGQAGRRRAEKYFDARSWARHLGRLYAAAAEGRPVTTVPPKELP